MSRVETMIGLPFERRPTPPRVAERASARAVLESLARDALGTAGPSFVLFSGGRDSSAVLAIASLVARREGLPLPIPVTARHPHSPESDETCWQEMVLDHLGIRDRVVLEFAGEQRILGDAARASLARHGVLWPASVHVQGPILSQLGTGSVMTGEGGDFVLDGLRMGDIRLPFHRGRPRRWEVRRAVAAATPTRFAIRRSFDPPPWLTPRGRSVFELAIKRNTNSHLWWNQQVLHVFDAPFVIVGEAGGDLVFAEHGLDHHPLFTHPRFVSALAREGGLLGFGSRTQVFRRLVGDLLPDAVISRPTKASFNSARWGADEIDFANRWDGSGIDPEWVNRELLRTDWLSGRPSSAGAFLMQVAWSAHHRLPAEDAGPGLSNEELRSSESGVR